MLQASTLNSSELLHNVEASRLMNGIAMLFLLVLIRKTQGTAKWEIGNGQYQEDFKHGRSSVLDSSSLIEPFCSAF